MDQLNNNKTQPKSILKSGSEGTPHDSRSSLKSALKSPKSGMETVLSPPKAGILKKRPEKDTPSPKSPKSILKTPTNNNQICTPMKSILKKSHSNANAQRKIDFSSSLKASSSSKNDSENGSGQLKSILKKSVTKNRIQCPLKSILKKTSNNGNSSVNHKRHVCFEFDEISDEENENDADTTTEYEMVDQMGDLTVNDQ